MSNNHLSSNAVFTRGVFTGDAKPNIEYLWYIMILTLTDQLATIISVSVRISSGEIVWIFTQRKIEVSNVPRQLNEI